MSYWSHTSSGAPGDTRPPYTNAPPLPPRNTGPDAVPPPIPPRPVGFGHHESVPPSRKDANSNTYRAYSPPKPSSSVPPIPEKVPLQTQASPGVRSPPADLPATHLRQSQAVYKECLAGGSTFAATWYTHHRAPKFPICPYCYETHIRGSRFAAEFRGSFCDDGEARACGFSGSRMKESLWNLALSSGSLDCVIEYMTLRPPIPDCVGVGGAKGDAGIKWYRAKNHAIPAMVVCQACYEDHILSHPRFGEEHFEPNTIEHAADQIWACDIALPYIYREYMVRAATNDWPAFVEGVTARLSMPPCPGTKTVYPSTRKWFTPTNGPQGLLICATCYCDYILLTGQDGTWRDAGDNLVAIFGASVACDFGAQFNLRMLAARTLETRDHALFWKGVEAVAREPTCGARMQGAAWYTLRSDPAGFEICGACYASLVESTGVAHHFMRKAAPAAGTPDSGGITCSFNPAVARFGAYMKNFQELVSTQDPGPLEAFVRVYAFMPTCRRDTHLENARWFGWNECTICPECYHEFVRGTALAEAMAPESVLVERGLMCEMYSPRMRQLILAQDPPDPKPLLEYSVQRRAVWAETMPRSRQILSNIRLKIAQQNMAMNNSLFYKFSGNLWQNTLPTYTSSAMGSGHYNHMQIKGAEYGRQASAIGSEISGSPAFVADELERRWRAVE
ncbi:hypothetical protein GGS24DRAFT_490590 [Hypoxylon argillaceum]|nr:hypothetical protein GGS24DRAFT_490590 [Hypoxylon argillaceum]